MNALAQYVWRLIPANPILLRVVKAGGKRRRDLMIRTGYLGLLIAVVFFSLLASIGAQNQDLSQLAKTSASLFEKMSILQLALVALLAPIFTAGAITQEKDSQTYNILLSTPLTNGQIVLGSLFSRLFFIIALLISGIPIFSITQIFGGVANRSILLSFSIAAATAFVTGALAIALFMVGSRRTLFGFYLFIVIYVVGLYGLDRLGAFHPADLYGVPIQTSWLTGLHPFLALRVVLNDPQYLPPQLTSLPPTLRFWPVGWYLTSPHTFYIAFMFTLSVVLVLPSVLFLRRIAQSTLSIRSWISLKFRLPHHDRARKPRPVWSNPIAWREARTKASSARASVVRYAFIITGLIGAMMLVHLYSSTQPVNTRLNRTGYDPVQHEVTIIDNDTPTTYRIDGKTLVTLNSKPYSLEADHPEFQVVSFTLANPRSRTLLTLQLASLPRRISAPQARSFLLGAMMIEFAAILLIVTNAAASTVTREKEDGTLDLLLATPITSRYYIWGKLRGLVSFILPLAAVPVLSVGLFVLYDLWRFTFQPHTRADQWIVFPEAILILPAILIVVSAFASMVGMHMSLRCRKTVVAVMASVGIMLGLCGALGWCGFVLTSEMRGANPVQLLFAGFSPFTLLSLLVDPYRLGGRIFDPADPSAMVTARIQLLAFSLMACGVYCLVIWQLYKYMVKNFDMTIRRQSR
ncbi:MAG: ABC transporter permease subunit [Phycisphaerales bacterium]|jgi:ABC-type transport system involved in multi-copper enzyme maturation permease subunit|nr:ABC transporter permease subunit [Phycisphaerales bacterium]